MNSTVQKVQGYWQSNATGTHGDRRLKRLRTRGQAKRNAIKEATK